MATIRYLKGRSDATILINEQGGGARLRASWGAEPPREVASREDRRSLMQPARNAGDAATTGWEA